jgi:hypothetical protein
MWRLSCPQRSVVTPEIVQPVLEAEPLIEILVNVPNESMWGVSNRCGNGTTIAFAGNSRELQSMSAPIGLSAIGLMWSNVPLGNAPKYFIMSHNCRIGNTVSRGRNPALRA